MPLYFFDIAEGMKRSDWAEADLPDSELARQFALGLGTTVTGAKARKKDHRSRFVLVRNKQGQIIDVIRPEDS